MASEIRANKQTNRVGLGTVTYTDTGIIVSGIVTANSFKGDGSSLTGIDATALKDGGGNVKVQANNSGINITGVTTTSEGIFVPDDKSIRIGGSFSNPDFKIHSSSTYQQAVIDYNRSGTGRALRIRATNLQIENWNGLTPTVKVIGGVGAGHVELNYAGNKKFETTNTGVVVSGILTATSFSGDGSSLSNLPASAPVGGASTNSVFFENDTAVAVNYQITTGKNAMSAGPIAINAGIAVTVPSGSSWTIV